MRKNILFSFILLVFTTSVFAQQLQEEPAVIINDLGSTKMTKTMTCGIDTNGYLLSKATGINALSINNLTSARGFSQYFDCPQDLTISGVNFYAYGTSIPSTPVTVNIYYANPADSFPTGTVLATTTINVDSTLGSGTMSELKKTAVFTSPITVNAPYVIEFTNYSGNNVAFICSDYTVADGQDEWLSGIDIGGTYMSSYIVNVGGFPFNADFIIEPYITYDFTAGYDNPTVLSCYNTSSNIMFSEKHPLMMNRMYSMAARYNQSDLYYGWDFGDGNPSVSIDTSYHTYSAVGNYTVLHTDTLFGYTNTCIDSTSFIITVDSIESVFGWNPNGLDVDFYDFSTTNSPGGITDWLWDFGDGYTSTTQFPTHTYASPGTYTVCLTAFNACVTDSSCAILTVNCNQPVAAFSNSINNLMVSFTNLSTSDDISPFYLWDFGDGNTSTQTDPTHTYASPGTYTVCLTISDSCGSDSSCAGVTITCLSPVSAFSSSTNNLTVNFTDLSTQSPSSWLWDFGDGYTSTAQSPSHTYAASGTYTICLTATNTCGSDSSCSGVTVSSTVGIEDLATGIHIYPNPVNNVLNIELNSEAIGKLFATDGRLVKQVILITGHNKINIGEFESGVYMLSIETDAATITYQIVIK